MIYPSHNLRVIEGVNRFHVDFPEIKKKDEAENLKQEIKVCVDIQRKVNELKKNIADKTC